MPVAIAETVLVTWLRSAFPGARVVTELPADLPAQCIRVTRFGGADESVSAFDNPAMDFDCYAGTREAARDLAYRVRSSLRDDLPGHVVAGGSVIRCKTISGPYWTPFDNTNVRRFTYTAQFRIRSI